MQRRMVVLDVTQMSGSKVCVGGYLVDGDPIRPVCFPDGPDKSWLRPTPDTVVAPFSVLELHVGGRPEQLVRPHIEDRLVPHVGHRVISTLPLEDRREWLEWKQATAVSEVFGAEVRQAEDQQWGRFVRRGEGERSLGTVRISVLHEILYRNDAQTGKREYRIAFQDARGERFRLAVVDLAFRARVDRAVELAGEAQAAQHLKTDLQERELYLRIGLARGWQKFPDRCYLQVTGVYSLPRD